MVVDNPPADCQMPERIGVVELAKRGKEGGDRRNDRGARDECADDESAQAKPSGQGIGNVTTK